MKPCLRRGLKIFINHRDGFGRGSNLVESQSHPKLTIPWKESEAMLHAARLRTAPCILSKLLEGA